MNMVYVFLRLNYLGQVSTDVIHIPQDDLIGTGVITSALWSNRDHCKMGKFLFSNGEFADDIFECIFMNEHFCISIQISLKFVPKGPIHSKSPLVHVMAWRRTGDRPLPEPMMTQVDDAYMRG